MANDRFVYVIYIRAPQQKVWRALMEPEFTRQYWQYRPGERLDGWLGLADPIPDGRVGDAGKGARIRAAAALSVSWRNEFIPGLADEGFTRCTYDLAHGDAVRLTPGLTKAMWRARR